MEGRCRCGLVVQRRWLSWRGFGNGHVASQWELFWTRVACCGTAHSTTLNFYCFANACSKENTLARSPRRDSLATCKHLSACLKCFFRTLLKKYNGRCSRLAASPVHGGYWVIVEREGDYSQEDVCLIRVSLVGRLLSCISLLHSVWVSFVCLCVVVFEKQNKTEKTGIGNEREYTSYKILKICKHKRLTLKDVELDFFKKIYIFLEVFFSVCSIFGAKIFAQFKPNRVTNIATLHTVNHLTFHPQFKVYACAGRRHVHLV